MTSFISNNVNKMTSVLFMVTLSGSSHHSCVQCWALLSDWSGSRGCCVDLICIAVMTVINLKHLESSRAEAVSLGRFNLLHSRPYCSRGNVMTVKREPVDGMLHIEKLYLCERSIKGGLIPCIRAFIFLSVAQLCAKSEVHYFPPEMFTCFSSGKNMCP